MRATLLFLSSFGFLLACSSSGTGSSEGDSNEAMVVSAADCTDRCEAKGAACHAPASQASAMCSKICESGNVTDDQITCIEKKSCDALAKGETIEALCPPASSAKSPSSSSTCSPKPTCDASGKSVVHCESGATITERCSDGTCKDGLCGYCKAASDCSPLAHCLCKDGKSFGTTVKTRCSSGRCSPDAPSCAIVCEDHGGY